MSDKKVVVSLHLTPAQNKQLRDMAKHDGKSLSTFVGVLVEMTHESRGGQFNPAYFDVTGS